MFLFLFGTVAAFRPQYSSDNNCNNAISTASARSPVRVPTTRLYYEEESEWYSPPPAPVTTTPPEEQVIAAPKLPRGVTPKTTVVQAKIDLEEFLAEDDRLCVVKFHASWYVLDDYVISEKMNIIWGDCC